MENFTTEAKNEVRRFLAEGRRITAVAYLCNTFNLTAEQAEQLVQIVERDKPEQRQVETLPHVEYEVPSAPAIDIHKEPEPNSQTVKSEGGCVKVVFKILAYIFLAVTIFSLAIAAIIYFMQEDTVSNGEKVTGIVTGFHTNDTGGSAPIVEYDWHGAKRTYNSTLFSTPPSFAVDEKVDIYINKENPEDALIDDFSERWLVITVFASIAAFFALFFLAFLFVSRKF